MSSFLDSQKIAKESGLRPRALLAPMALAVVVSFAASGAFFLYLHYTQGGLSLYSYPRYNAGALYGRAASAIGGAGPPADATAYGGVLVGAAVTCLLVWMRAQFVWFPFHPLGYALCAAGTMNVYWFPFLLAWMVKSLILRFGGIDTYRRIAPFMLGLIGGEFMMGMFWAIMNMWRGWSAPPFPWP